MFLKSEKGSITIFVLVGLLFMTAFLIIAYGANVNNSKIVKEQFNMISEIYMPNDNIVESYIEAYTDLRTKKKGELRKTIEGSTQIEIEKCYADDIVNYQIYGNEFGFGREITDETDANYGKYEITIKVRDTKEEKEDGIEEVTPEYTKNIYKIYIDTPLASWNYIDYETSTIYNINDDEEIIEVTGLPKLVTYEDYTSIEIYGDEDEIPSKIIVDYIGYTFEEEEQNEN